MRNGDGLPTGKWSMGEVGTENVFLQDASPKGLIEKVANLPVKGDVWGMEKQLEVDQLLLMDKIEKFGNIRDYWLATPDNENIGAIMANELGPMKDILLENYGQDWRNEASEEVLGQLLHNVFLIERRNLHGKVVMDKLSEFRDGKLQENGTWRFLPENKRERQKLVEHAKAYDSRRIDVRKQSLDTMMAIFKDKGFTEEDKAYWGIRQRFLDQWEKEDLVRWKSSLYDFDGNGRMQLRVWKEANKRIEQGDTPELGLIVGKVKEIAKVRDERGLIESLGVTESESGKLVITDHHESKKPPAITILARARMALEHGRGLSKATWETYHDGATPWQMSSS